VNLIQHRPPRPPMAPSFRGCRPGLLAMLLFRGPLRRTHGAFRRSAIFSLLFFRFTCHRADLFIALRRHRRVRVVLAASRSAADRRHVSSDRFYFPS
jgi:hypothetical protein